MKIKTLAAFQEQHAKNLDAAWLKKYPAGMWYVIVRNDGTVDYGHLPRRPTSGSQRITWCDTTGRSNGGYVGRSFYYVKQHDVYATFDAFVKRLHQLGIRNHRSISFPKP